MTIDPARVRPTDAEPAGVGSEPVRARSRIALGLSRFSGVYVLVALCIGFSIWLPDTFATVQNVKVVAQSQAVTGLLALGLMIPLAAGVFDLSVAANMGLASVVVIKLQASGWNVVLACLVAIVGSAIVGVLNGAIITRFKVDSFIITLGMSSVLAAASYKVTNGQQIVDGISSSFLKIGTATWFGVPAPVFYFAIAAALIWFMLEHRPLGRVLFAVGGNRQAARLAGVRTDRMVFVSLVGGATLAGVAGVLLASELGVGDPTSGPPYLLPVFSAVFLGATQIRPGRVNVVGTIISIYLLAVGVKGLQLAGAPSYVSDLFNGLALIVAVSLAASERRRR